MKEKKMLTITKLDGTVETVEEVISFEFSDTLKKYVVYTKNETDDAGNVTIYVASLIRVEGADPKLGSVETDEEWARIKNVLKELSKDDDAQ